MKSIVKLSMLLMVAGLVSSSMGALGSAVVEFDFQYLSDGSTVVTDGAAITDDGGSWRAANVYDSAGTPDTFNVAGNVPTYAAYDTTGLPAGMDGYAINTGGLWNPGGAVGNAGNGFTSTARVNLLGVNSDWTTIIGRPGQYIVFMNPDGNLSLFINGVGDVVDPAVGVLSAAEFGTFTDTWVDLAFTFDGVGDDTEADTYSLYVNGQLVYSDTQITNLGSGDVEHLGATGGGGQVFGGLIDHYAFYDGTATAEEIAAMTVIPEPATMALLGLGGLLLRRKK